MKNHPRYKTRIALLFALLTLLSLSGCVKADPAPTPTPTATPTATSEPTPSPSPEPNADFLALGVGDEIGYLSKYFDFGFRLPEEWKAYDREMIDTLNMVRSDISDTEAYDQEYQALLKSGQTIYDYVGYRKAANEMIFVLLKDNSDSGMGAATEQEAVDAYAASICDIGGDGTIDAKNIQKQMIKIGNTEHPMTRYELPLDSAYGYGAVLAIRKNDVVALVSLICPEEQMLQSTIDSFYQYSDFPSLEEYSMARIDTAGFESDFLGLAFEKPTEWGYYTREQMNYLNQITLKESGKDALSHAYQEALKSNTLVMEYCGYEKDLLHMVYVFSASATENKMEFASSRDFNGVLLLWLLDYDHNGTIDVKNGTLGIETMLGQPCYTYRFDDRGGTSGVIGCVFSYRRGSTFVGVEVISVVPGEIEKILPLLSVPK